MKIVRFIVCISIFAVSGYVVYNTSLVCRHGCFNKNRANVFGRPSLETALEYCENEENNNLSERFVATLYRGDGGATSSFWYSIAVKFKDEREIQIFWTYSGPEISNLNCHKDGLSFHAAKDEEFNIDQIRKLIKDPIGYNRNALDMKK